jgi:UDP-2-acetamido-3-amino-2,3-dideoxy-glucuronate N-acetyltransferase
MESQEQRYFAHESAVIDDGCKIGPGTRIWHFSHIMKGAEIGCNCNIGQNVVVSPQVILGNGVKVQNNVSIYTGVTCEDDVFLGPSMVFTNVINPRSAVVRSGDYVATIVRKGVSIGANATIVCGIEIGIYAFIGAGAVVTKDVKPYALVVGNPAIQKGWMSEFGWKLEFDKNGFATCQESNEVYKMENQSVYKIK